ncbi:MAG: hypothetical protein LBQ83_04790 [Candidatus Margulisbacteria bacterium]|jgi:hypothetical protein|nr:hypothetical protein [Candidatus Margulisiibacteriota bacterium]
MKKIFLILAILSMWAQAHDITVSNIIDLGAVYIDSGFYGDPPGNIELSITTTGTGQAVIHAGIDERLTSAENFQLPADSLQWQVYYWTGKELNQPFKGEILQGGASSWVPYRRGSVPIIRINEVVNNYKIQLGTTIRRVPAVQPNGRYTTKVNFEIDDF